MIYDNENTIKRVESHLYNEALKASPSYLKFNPRLEQTT